MNPAGIIFLMLGLIWGVLALKMDTTVETGGDRTGVGLYSVDIPRTRVHNPGLMEERRNDLIMACVAVVGGILLFGFGSVSKPVPADETKPCPYCTEPIKKQAKICRFCQKEVQQVGTTDVSSPQTRTHSYRRQSNRRLSRNAALTVWLTEDRPVIEAYKQKKTQGQALSESDRGRMKMAVGSAFRNASMPTTEPISEATSAGTCPTCGAFLLPDKVSCSWCQRHSRSAQS